MRSSNSWDDIWVSVFDRYQQDLRNAYYLRAFLKHDESQVLELGAGSFRDMIELNRKGVNCSGVDFSDESIERAKSLFNEYSNLIHKMDIFNLNFDEKAFDVTFHNGLIGLFEYEKMEQLLKEQARVTKKRMIVTVHNAHNENFKAYFEEKKKTDPLYDIRFFYKDEMEKLMKKHCVDVTIIPVGKAKKSYEDFLIKIGLGHPMLLRFLFKISGHRLIHKSERLMCIGTLAE